MENLNPYRHIGKLKIFKKDELVFTQDTTGDDMFVVLKGTFTAYINSFGKNPMQAAEFKEGDFFGEMAVIDNWSRSATIFCTEAGMAVAIGKEHFTDLLECNPDISKLIFNSLYERAEAIDKTAREEGHFLTTLPTRAEFGEKPQNPNLDLIHMSTLAERIRGINDILGDKKTVAAQKIKLVEVQENADAGEAEGKAADTAESGGASLFPEGHGDYSGKLKLAHIENPTSLLSFIKTSCPLCKTEFEEPFLMQSRLRRTVTDPDMRARFADVEPMHYAVVTCPFSATNDLFQNASKRLANDVNQKTGPYCLDIKVSAGRERDTFTVFAGYYLALLCAPVVSETPPLAVAKLWLNLDRIYQDAGDQNMADFAAKKAFDSYKYAFEHVHMSEKASQQLCYIMGDLTMRVGDIHIARNYFFMCKSNKAAGSAVMEMQADKRLEQIREQEQLKAEAAKG
jgi:uncharacterized protein (DUF2225 family)